jgi:hypothetical protein
MTEVMTLSPISCHRAVGLCVMPHALAAVTMRRAHEARVGHALPVHRLAWATQRPLPWASQLGFVPVGHYGHGLQRGLKE